MPDPENKKDQVTPETDVPAAPEDAAPAPAQQDAPTEEKPEAPTEDMPAAPAEDAPDAPAEPPAPAESGEQAPPEDTTSFNGISLGMALCDAVLYAVGREQFHGGVRPDNISVRDDQVFLGSTLKHTVGEFTPQELEYMAPELFWDGIRSPSADVYSLGLVLYSLYNYGRLPFWPNAGVITPNARAAALQKRMGDQPLIPPARADAELAAVILRALAFRTEERWQDVAELRDALGSCDAANSPIDISLAMSGLLSRSTEPRDTEPPAQTGKTRPRQDDGELSQIRAPRKRRNLSWLWILLLVILIAGAVVMLLNDNFSSPSLPNEPVATAVPTPEPTPAPTPEPTPEPTPTPVPVKKPTGPKYMVFQEDVSWTEAERKCQEYGGWLAMPANEEEFNAIIRLCGNEHLTYVWLGASRQTDENNTEKWISTTGELVTYYTTWADGEPSKVDPGDGAEENYMLLWNLNDQWVLNDSRDDPLQDFGYIYRGQIGYVCQMW